ncbi:MAG: Fic family protein [Coriobacteriia bacterium]|nr:Fic family protein [Coriobacteriia bacterium]
MRRFDYSTTSKLLHNEETLRFLLCLREFKGKQVLLNAAKPAILTSLHEQAHFASTEASNRIEGIVTTKARFKQILKEKAAPSTRSEKEIAGYRDVLALIHSQYEYIQTTPAVILQLHRDLLKYTSYSYGGSWKDTDNQIVAQRADGTAYVRFKPTPAIATPDAVAELCETYRLATAKENSDPLLLAMRFVFDFVSIHPFNDGNGRMSRLLTVLLLEKCGYLVPRYISIEEIIGKHLNLYYETLAESSTGWETGNNNEAPFINFMLGILCCAYRDLFDCVEASMRATSKARRIAETFEYALGKISKDDIRKRCPDISDSSIERELKRLLDEGEIKKVGGGRTTAYIKI